MTTYVGKKGQHITLSNFILDLIYYGIDPNFIYKILSLKEPMKLYCNNKSAINIVHNPVQCDQTKNIEMTRNLIKEKLD